MLSAKKRPESYKESLQPGRFPDSHPPLLYPTLCRLMTLDLLGGQGQGTLMKMQADQAFITHVRHELQFFMLA